MRAFKNIATVPFAAALMVAAALFSCDRDDPDPTEDPRGLSMQISDEYSLEDGVTATFDMPKEFTLTILARVPWSLTVNADWVTPSERSGIASPGSVDVVFALDRNDTRNSRKATVTITTPEKEPYTFTITQQAENVLTGVNQWMYEEMGRYYYWNRAVRDVAPPKNTLSYDAFLSTLITSLEWEDVQDTSNGESPATIDGPWNKKDDGREANTVRDGIYSYVERVSGATRTGEITEQTLGMVVEPFRIRDSDNLVGFLVLWTQPGGPADTQGLKRGMWITKSNGANITESSWGALYTQIWNGTGYIDVTTSDNRTFHVTAAQTKVQPLPITPRTITSPVRGTKVAYMLYNGFEIDADANITDERLPNDRFMVEMRNAFAGFRADGATEMVLDLRYNPGGYVTACQILSSLITGAGTGDVFVKMKRNDDFKTYDSRYKDNPEVKNFFNEGNALGLRKLYVLATKRTASASEMVINALRGIGVEVVIVGEQTNGKNVGMDRFNFTDSSGKYYLWPITFKALNAKDFCDYAGGFAPTWELDETYDKAQKGGTMYPLGDPDETLLKAALTLIDGGKPAAQTRTRAQSPAFETLPTPPNRRGGAKYIPAAK